MAAKTLPVTASDADIKALVVAWSELLAHGNYGAALALFLVSRDEHDWTADLLEETIRGYGVPGLETEVLTDMLAEHGVSEFVVTSLENRPDREEILRDHIHVDRENLFGLDPAAYVGMVHYSDLPLSGFRSDLTARFHIKRLSQDCITLEFLDVHVM